MSNNGIPAGYLSRTDVRKRLKCSATYIRSLVDQKQLTVTNVTIGRQHRAIYKTSEVELLEQGTDYITRRRPPKDAGARAEFYLIQAFALFKKGCTRSDVVVALELPPAIVDQLYDKYCDDDLESGRADRLNKAALEAMEDDDDDKGE